MTLSKRVLLEGVRIHRYVYFTPKTSLERITAIHLGPALGHLVWGALLLDVLQELIYQGGLLHRTRAFVKSAICEEGPITIEGGKARLVGISKSGGSVMSSKCKIRFWVGKLGSVIGLADPVRAKADLEIGSQFGSTGLEQNRQVGLARLTVSYSRGRRA